GFAVFMAAISFCLSFWATILGGLKLQFFLMGFGLQVGWIVAPSMIVIPTIVASYVGAITVPNSQLKIASVVFPSLIFLTVNIVFALGKASQDLYFQTLLETGAGCLIAAMWLYLRWTRQLLGESERSIRFKD